MGIDYYNPKCTFMYEDAEEKNYVPYVYFKEEYSTN
jgi:hypothetical protein